MDEERPVRRMLIVVSATLATLLYTIDTTIANVALPHIQGGLQATQDQVLWVLTSYIVMSAVTMPLTGFLATRFGERPVLLASVAGFTLASMGCGISTSLPELVALRAAQGIFGSALIPITQAALLGAFPREQAIKAMSIWGIGVMVGPVIGPTLGGWLTEIADWRWVFFVNVPVGLLAWLGLAASVPAGARAPNRPFDLKGYLMLALCMLCAQLMFDRGNERDWFASPEILAELVLALIMLYMFVVHSLTTPHPFFELAIFRDRNMVASILALALLYPIMMVPAALLPAFLQQLQNHSALDAGLVMAPRGAAMSLVMLGASRLVAAFGSRVVMLVGLAAVTLATWPLAYITPDYPTLTYALVAIFQGVGMGLTFVAINAAGFATLPGELRAEATVVATLSRSLAGGIAISVFGTLLSRSAAGNYARLTTYLTPFDHLAPLTGAAPAPLANAMMAAELSRQASVIGYENAFAALTALTLFAIIPILAFRQSTRRLDGGDRLGQADALH